LGPRVSYYSRDEKAECAKNFSLVLQLERYVDLGVFVERRGERASVMESLHKLVLLCPPVSQPDVKRLPFVLWYVSPKHLHMERVVIWGSGNATRDVADRHIFRHIESANVHVNSGRRYPIKEDRSQSIIELTISHGWHT